MDQSSNKTIMCSVFFLDIVGYSKRSVAGQISLKERFNSYLSAAIRDVPLSDRIILDTGDGAAINFLGDVEDALKAALSLRSSMLHEDPSIEPALLVRMGINLGPVRLIRDINGQPNIVGDGINVAQRVMGFADASQILVSRSYFDAVSRLSPQYAGMFHYQGSRTDKHVREHEVYAIGYPGEKTARTFAVKDSATEQSAKFSKFTGPLLAVWNSVLQKLDGALEFLPGRYAKIEPRKRPLVVAAVGVPLVVILVLGMKSALRDDEPPMPVRHAVVHAPRVTLPASGVSPAGSSVAAASAVAVSPSDEVPHVKKEKKPKVKKPAQADAQKAVDVMPEAIKKPKPLTEKEKAEQTANHAANKLLGFAKNGEGSSNAKISLVCSPGTLLFVDGVQKGKIVTGEVAADVSPGKHAVIAILPSQKLFNQSVDVPAGKMVRIRPPWCN